MQHWSDVTASVTSDTCTSDSLSDTVELINAYVAGGDRSLLVEALIRTIQQLSEDLGQVVPTAIPAHFIDFLAQNQQALSAYCEMKEKAEQKYPRFNFREGAPVLSYLDAALRHVLKRAIGQIYDEDSKQPTMAHVLFGLWLALDQPPENDDRWEPADNFGISYTTNHIELTDQNTQSAPITFKGHENLDAIARLSLFLLPSMKVEWRAVGDAEPGSPAHSWSMGVVKVAEMLASFAQSV